MSRDRPSGSSASRLPGPSIEGDVFYAWWGGRLRKPLQDQRLRFVAVGAFNTGFGYAAFVFFNLLVGMWIGYLGSLLCAHAVSSTTAFILYRRFVFQVRGRILGDYLRFQSVYAASLGVNMILLPTLVEVLSWQVYVAQAVALTVTVVFSYVGHKFFSFRRDPAVRAATSGDASD